MMAVPDLQKGGGHFFNLFYVEQKRRLLTTHFSFLGFLKYTRVVVEKERLMPEFFDTKQAEELRANNPHIFYVDAFPRQIRELFFIDNTTFIGTDKAAVFASQDFSAYVQSKEDEHVHVYYPWNYHLVKTVTARDYFRLKTNRNQDLITADEQKKLADFRVAVLGMSVGSNIAFILTQAGISRNITLADFDELDTTNLNRIFAGVHQIGLNKTIVAAQHIYEDNPFAEVIALQDGINEENLNSLLSQKKIDCIVEEIDDIPFKIKTRLLAREYRIPVVMITDNGDGVVLHVERYDLGHEKIFGKDTKYFGNALSGEPLNRQRAGKIIMEDIVCGAARVDPKMLASVQRVFKKELVSWSQLGSAAMLGGVMATYAIKQIVLGSDKESDIRAYIHPAQFSHGSHTS